MGIDSDRTVRIELDYDEALVLSGWLSRCDLSSARTLEVSPAELIALGQLDTALEPKIDEVFDHTWDESVRAASERLVQRFPG
jgi:hypothetical protein